MLGIADVIETVNGGVKSCVGVDENSSDKTDSGMDEGPVIGHTEDKYSPVALDTGEAESDEDDVPIVRRKPSKKSSLFDDDDDDDSRGSSVISADKDPSNRGMPPKKLTADEALSKVLDAESEDSDQDEQKDGSDTGDDATLSSVLSSQKLKSRIKRGSFLGDDSNDSSERSYQSSRGTQNDKSETQGNTSNKMTFDNDIFDAESDSDNGGRLGNSKSERSESEGSGDEGYEESDQEGRQLNAQLEARLKKGAGKKPKRESRRQAEKDNIMELHSETQRLVRESRVNIPYHQPKPMSLSDFLNRAAQKQSTMKALRGPAGFKNVSWYEEKEREKEKQKEKDKLLREAAEKEAAENNVLESVAVKLKPLAAKQLEDETCISPDTGSDSGRKTIEISPSRRLIEDFDELPDLIVEVDANNERLKTEGSLPCDELPDISGLQSEAVDGNKEFDSLCEGTGVEVSEQTRAESVPSQPQYSGATEEVLNISGIQLFEDPEEGVFASVISGEDISPKNATSDNVNIHVNNSKLSNVNISSSANTSEANVVKTCSNQTPKLAALSSPNLKIVTPKLSGAPDSFIVLEESDERTPVNSGFHKLMSRYIQHSKKKKPHQSKDVSISVVHKEKVSGEKEELKVDTLVYHVEEEKESLEQFDTPGAKLTALKEQLSAQMKVKRDEARQKRMELYELDNEEGFNKEEEEEEAEMTDGSDTEEEDGEYQPGDEIRDEEDGRARETNPYVDEEADDEDDDGSDDEDCDEVDGEVAMKPALDDDEDDDSMSLKLALSDAEDEADKEDENDDDDMIISSQNIQKKKKSRVLRISDDDESKDVPEMRVSESEDPLHDLHNDTMQSKEDESLKTNIDSSFEDGEMTPFTKHLSSVTQPESWSCRKVSKSLSLPIEDSQDLYSNSMMEDVPHDGVNGPSPSQNLSFFMEDTESQMLDENGFLRINSTLKKPARKPIGLTNPVYPEDTMEELLGLCSGKFVDGTQKPESVSGDKKTSRSLFSQLNVEPATQMREMDELLGLCSGKFVEGTQKAVASQKRGIKRRPVADDEDSDAESESSFKFLSDDEDKQNNDKDEFASDNEDEQSDTCLMPAPKLTGFNLLSKKKQKEIREFIEEEAELSGSEYDSDENLDLAEEDDIMEAEAGDQDVHMSEEELRNQVGRVHMKNMMDDDHREMIKLQELYLPDGDLHSDGKGRTRRFRWSNMDDDTQQDMFANRSDEDAPEEEGENDIKWRMERHEREKWIQEQRDSEAADDSNSQFMKFGKLVLKQRNKAAESVPRSTKAVDQPLLGVKAKAVPEPKLTLSQKRGSFLSRSKDHLAKIAERTKSGVKTISTGRNPNNFVFKPLSPESQDKKTGKVNPAPKRSYSVPSGSQPPSAKRTKTEESSFSQNSIFNLFN